ncbi:glycosyltransferase family 2 protein [Geojedonia litorea]|uniref:Glycosyltransferase family 2 protein n=1 Tax=Geojedonia litorea TaxID=1268269 RepID=A0ABV9N3M4_9FLAO
MPALVSIIIPNYNRAHLILCTLDSIISQTYPHWECLVIDDGSSDRSAAVIQDYADRDARIRYYERPANRPRGANACRNYGLELSQGDYINWFDSDDLMHPEKLEQQLKALESVDFPFCVCQSLEFEESVSNIIGLKSKHIYSNNPLDDFLQKKIIWLTQAPLFRKSFLFDHYFRFDEALQAGQEWEFFTRILIKQQYYCTVEVPLVYIRRHADSISNQTSLIKDWNYYLTRDKIYTLYKSELSMKSQKYLRKFFITSFKLFLRNKKIPYAYKIWRKNICFDFNYSLKSHFYILMSLLSFLMFKKGEYFLTKVKP